MVRWLHVVSGQSARDKRLVTAGINHEQILVVEHIGTVGRTVVLQVVHLDEHVLRARGVRGVGTQGACAELSIAAQAERIQPPAGGDVDERVAAAARDLRDLNHKTNGIFLLISKHTELFFCYMLHAQNLSYIHILYTQKGVYIIFEYKKNFEREAFRFSMHFYASRSRSLTLIIIN